MKEAKPVEAKAIKVKDSRASETKAAKIKAYDRVTAARAKGRPTAVDYIDQIFEEFMEMHGDRRYADDPAVVAGIASLKNMSVTVVGIEKGHDTKDKVKRNFGSVHPEGYRKALRQMKLAEKFGRPIICFVDTSGADCGLGAEERGQGQAIAENMMEMMTLRVPILTIFIGEGGSGGALALAVADQVWMLENAVYSVISPEGCASILWKDSSKTKEAAECLKMTSYDLLELKAVERVIPESSRFNRLFAQLRRDIFDFLSQQLEKSKEELLEERYNRFRKMGL